MLTGPPRIDGLLRPHCDSESPVVEEWADESAYKEMDDGLTVLAGGRRLRPRWTMGWRGLAEGHFLSITAALRKESFEITPRTARGSESAESERTYAVRCVSDLPGTKPIRQEGFDLQIELVALRCYDESLAVI